MPVEVANSLRLKNTRWRVAVINGTNMSNLINRNSATFGPPQTIKELESWIVETGEKLGIEIQTFCSNHQGEIIEWIHENGFDGRFHAIVINPAGLTSYAEPVRHCLEETGLPYIEVHYANQFNTGRQSVFTRTATGMCHGMRKHSYIAALAGLVGMLDEGILLGRRDISLPQSDGGSGVA